MPDHTPRVLASHVNQALAAAGIATLPDDSPRGALGLKTAQMLDSVLVLCSVPSAAEAAAMRDRARRALRGGGFMVKDSPQVSAILYVIDRL